jgi:hypothetical protein
MGYKDSPCLSPAEHSKKSEKMPFNLTYDFNYRLDQAKL